MAVQNHIHLSLAVGSAPENAPTLKWAVLNRTVIPEVVVSLKRNLRGRLAYHRLRNEAGTIKFQNVMLIVKIDADYGYTLDQRLEQIRAMNGEYVYYVDNDHVADGADHTAYVRRMACKIGELPQFTTALIRYHVEVSLMDAFTVP